MKQASSPSTRIDLSQPLPGEVLRNVSGGLAAYRNYPVFSWPWLRKRTVLFAIGVGCFGALSGIGTYAAQRRLDAAVGVTVQFTIGFLLMTSLGPLLATIVRHRGMTLRRERVWVVAALLVGIYTSFRADDWASRGIGEKTRMDFEGNTLNGQLPVRDMGAAALAVNLGVLIVIYGFLGGGLAVRRYFDEPRRMSELLRERELVELRAHKQAVELRLGVLQAQVEPHFLFNTLASVRALIVLSPDKAQAIIDALVDYLRATIPRLRDHGAQVDSTLGQQLELCESYLKLMQLRMGGRFSYVLDLPVSLQATSFPPLLLISLVENAVKHGIEPKPGPGRIEIRAAQEAAGLHISVIDDGVGLRDQLGVGVGLTNVREQLRARYDDRARLSLSRAAGHGTVASIFIETAGAIP